MAERRDTEVERLKKENKELKKKIAQLESKCDYCGHSPGPFSHWLE